MDLYSLIKEQSDRIDNLGIYYKKELDYTKLLRRPKEDEWVRSLRQTRGKYDPEILAKIHPNASKVFVKYTRFKIHQWKAGLQNIILPDNDKNWGIKPTPKPTVSNEDLAGIIAELKKSGLEPSMDLVDSSIKNLAEKKCKEMELEMEDQLADIKYDYIVKETINSALKYGTGIIKGIQTRKSQSNEIVIENGQYRQVSRDIYVPYFENTRIWDYYPDMDTTEKDNIEFEWERMILTKHQLKKLAKKDRFYGDVITAYLRDNPKGNAKYEQWELDLNQMDTNKFKDTMRSNRYEVYTRHGYVDVDDLREAGLISEETEVDEVMCDIWLLGNRVIKIEKSEYIEPLYHLFYFEKDETSIFGTGLPTIIRDTQQTMCSAMRMTLDNGAICAAPQVEVNTDLLEEGEDPDDFRARRVWKRTGRSIEAQIPAIRTLQFDSHVSELIKIVDKSKEMGEMEISFALYPQEEMEQPTRQSLGEASMRASSRIITVKEIVKQWDDCSNSVINSLYQWNMMYNDKNYIKGDFQTEARGVTTLLSKEILTQRVAYFTQTLTPEERMYIKPGAFLLQKAKILDLDPTDWIKTDEEVAKEQASQGDEELDRLMKEKLSSEILYDRAKATHMESKAAGTGIKSDLEVINMVKGGQNAGKAGKG